ncbi:MAG: DNA translocase FtsK 4TM domain-containing protein, partial [Gemmataceae bacterium]
MMSRLRIRPDVAAFAVLLSGLLVALALFTRDGADPPATAIYPANAVARNVLGLPGAWLAFQLNETFGVACYPLLAGWFVLAVMLFARKNWGAWTLRLLGWLVLVPSVAIVGHFLSAVIAERPLVGAGGNLGAWLAALLEARYQSMGTWALTASLLMLGFVLAFDVVLAALGRVMLRTGASIARLFERPTQDQRTAVRGLAPETPVAEVIIALDDYVDEDPVVEATAEEVIVPINHADAEATTVTAGASLSAALPIKRPTPQLQEEARFPDYELPPLTLLEDPAPFPYEEHDKVLREKAALLEKTFTDFHLNVKVVGINTGPVITQYEVALETGLRVNKVTRLADDLALNLSVPSVRIVAPIPGKNTVGVEIPNEHRANVRLKEIICMFGGKLAKSKIPLFIGKDTEGQPLVYDLAEMPHLLIAGRTGTGKSVCMNSIILSILMTRSPDDVKMIMIDPKMLELSEYGKIPHLMHPVVKDMKKAEAILAWAVDKMEERYDILSRAKVRSIASYNELSHEEILDRVRPVDEEDEKRVPAKMPYIVIFVDEMADLMMMMRKEVEGHIIRLAQ